MKKIALITGVNGQDGSYLAHFLLSKNYEVHGTVRSETTDLWRLSYLNIVGKVTIHNCDLENYSEVTNLCNTINPNEMYHLAAQSSVPLSMSEPYMTFRFNFESTLNILEYTRDTNADIKVFHASTSEIFDPAAPSPLTKDSPIKPVHPYGTSKAASHAMVQSYRESFGTYAVNGILFPHESPLRNRNTFLQQLITQAKKVSIGEAENIVIAEPENVRDFGDARSYVKAMWHSLQPTTSDDYIICSGAPVSIQEIVNYVIDTYNLSPNCITIDNNLVRQPNIPVIFAEAKETAQKINWSNSIAIYETIESLIEFNTKNTNNAN